MSAEAMKLALEALKQIDEAMPFPVAKLAQSALREALAEQPAQQEPVAWICEGSSSDEKHAIDYWPGDIEDIPIGTKLYTSPQAQQEPVAKPYAYEYGRDNGDGTYSVVIEKGDLVQTAPAVYNYVRPRNAHKDWPIKELFDHPPASKPWVGLTDEEIEKGRDQTFSINNPYCPCDSKTMRKAARWAEAKLKEKNQ